MGHDSAKMVHDCGKIAILVSTWELLGWFWQILAHRLENNKYKETLGLVNIFLIFEVPGRSG